MKINRKTSIDVSPDRAWDLLANRYASCSEWASDISHSKALRDAKPLRGAPCSGRVCETSMGAFNESIVEFDARARVLTYTAEGESMPFFVKSMKNTWEVLAEGPGTRVEMRMQVDLMFPFSLLMAPMMKLQMGKVVSNVLEELTFFLERGKPHPRKLSAFEAAIA